MTRDDEGFEAALADERARNGRQVAAFRFAALAVVVVLQLVFLAIWDDWTGAPLAPLIGYTVVAGVAWRLRRRFDFLPGRTGYIIAFVDMPMAYWLISESVAAQKASPEPELAPTVLMLMPLIYAGFIVQSSLALDVRQTAAAAVVAISLQVLALSREGRDITFLVMVSAFTTLIAMVCMYWREETVRLVSQTAREQLRRERLGRYFSPLVARLVETGRISSGDRREVTVLFADLRNFTRLAEKLDSRQVVVLLNRFHEAMVEIVFAEGGTLDKYLGDGLMAYFGAPVEQADQAARALRCATRMQEALPGLGEHGGERLRMGIGVHTGPAVVGDIGAESRREFTVIGDTVNVAARLEQLTKELDVPVLVSGATIAAAGNPAGFGRVKSVTLRGRSEPIDVYAPVEKSGSATEFPVRVAERPDTYERLDVSPLAGSRRHGS